VSCKFKARISQLCQELERRLQPTNTGVVCVGREPTEEEAEAARLRGMPIMLVHFVAPGEAEV
jgi:hypothetical protein